LFTLEQFTQFIGQPVKIRLSRPLNARRTFTGRLQQVKERIVTVVEAGTEYNLPYDQIHKAYLVPDF
jgi:ribosome maturation factor RimP